MFLPQLLLFHFIKSLLFLLYLKQAFDKPSTSLTNTLNLNNVSLTYRYLHCRREFGTTKQDYKQIIISPEKFCLVALNRLVDVSLHCSL